MKKNPTKSPSFLPSSATFRAQGSLVLGSFCVGMLFFACKSDPDVSGGGSGDGDGDDASSLGGAGNDGSMSDIEFSLGGMGGLGDGGEPRGEVEIVTELPDGFVGADAFGGWDVVGPVEDVDVDGAQECANILRVIARDFPASHPDFQRGSNGLYPGIVDETLGADRKPTLADPSDAGDLVDSAESFDQWYRNVEGENLPFVMDLWLEPVDDTFVFDSSTFFPLTERGYALEPGGQGQSDGFHFTTELHTSFEYKGGENFTFRGDDDVWVFIDGKLAIDIGGVHGAEEASVELDTFAVDAGLEIGEVYTLDLFQAERQTVQSNFRIQTTLDFTDCGEILEVDIPR